MFWYDKYLQISKITNCFKNALRHEMLYLFSFLKFKTFSGCPSGCESCSKSGSTVTCLTCKSTHAMKASDKTCHCKIFIIWKYSSWNLFFKYFRYALFQYAPIVKLVNALTILTQTLLNVTVRNAIQDTLDTLMELANNVQQTA